MRIIAFDPGTRNFGYCYLECVMDKNGDAISIARSKTGMLNFTDEKLVLDNDGILSLATEVDDIMARVFAGHATGVVVVERMHQRANIISGTVMEDTNIIIGVILTLIASKYRHLYRYSVLSSTWKMFIGRENLRDLYKESPKSKHEVDALLMALWGAQKRMTLGMPKMSEVCRALGAY